MATESQQISAVRKQKEKADKLWQDRYGKKVEPEPAKPVETPPVKAEPPAEPPAPDPEPSKPAEPEPAKATEAEPAPAPQPPPVSEPDYKAMYEKTLEESKTLKSSLDTEKQRFQTLQGKYNAEVPRMQYQINTLMEEMAKVKEQPPVQAPASNGPDNIPSSASKSLKEDYPELFEGISARVHEVSKSLVEPLVQRIKKLEEEKVTTAASSYTRELTKAVPNWQALNNDPEFMAWLVTYEPNGRTRHEMMLDAFNRKDVEGTAYYFNTFLDSRKPPEPPAQPNPPQPPTPPPEPSKGKPLAVPRGGGTGTPTPTPEETYTPADLVAHTREKISGLWKGREDEWKKKEIKITKYLVKHSRKG